MNHILPYTVCVGTLKTILCDVPEWLLFHTMSNEVYTKVLKALCHDNNGCYMYVISDNHDSYVMSCQLSWYMHTYDLIIYTLCEHQERFPQSITDYYDY